MPETLDILLVSLKDGTSPNWEAANQAIEAFGIDRLLDESITASFDLSRLPDPFDQTLTTNAPLLAEARAQLAEDLHAFRDALLDRPREMARRSLGDQTVYIVGGMTKDGAPTAAYAVVDRLISAGVIKAAGFEVGAVV